MAIPEKIEQRNSPKGYMPQKKVVFLLGIMPRSGTNFLFNLLCAHPEISYSVRNREDFLLENAHHLEAFAQSVYNSWDKLWDKQSENPDNTILKALGAGLERFLLADAGTIGESKFAYIKEDDYDVAHRQQEPKVILARTPSVRNLRLLPQLTNAKALITIRDGRSVIESGMRSFGWLFEDAAQNWKEGANAILSAAPKSDQIRTVRFEDLINDQANQLREIFQYLEVDPELYDYGLDLPVIGSSTHFDPKTGMNWGATKKSQSFDPLNRWRHWSRANHERFNWVAGNQSEQLGYSLQAGGGWHWIVYNRLLDIVIPVRRLARRLIRKFLPLPIRERILWRRGEKYRAARAKQKTLESV